MSHVNQIMLPRRYKHQNEFNSSPILADDSLRIFFSYFIYFFLEDEKKSWRLIYLKYHFSSLSNNGISKFKHWTGFPNESSAGFFLLLGRENRQYVSCEFLSWRFYLDPRIASTREISNYANFSDLVFGFFVSVVTFMFFCFESIIPCLTKKSTWDENFDKGEAAMGRDKYVEINKMLRLILN